MRWKVLWAALPFVAACGAPSPDEQTALALERAIAEASKSGRQFELGAIAGPDWDRAIAFAPYTPIPTMPANIGGDRRVADSGIDSRDDVSLIVFLASDRVISVVPLRRSLLDFAGIAGMQLRPSDCVQMSADSPPTASIVPACGK